MIDALVRVQAWTAGSTRQSLEGDEMLAAAVIRCLEVAGEGAKAVSSETRAMDNEIPWKSIAGFRDVVIHQYFRVDLDAVWDIVTALAPELEKRVRTLLAQLKAQDP
ncbi:MAG: DUF86 domain-containing protein [Dehalococcoidia bacterium]